MFIMLCFFLKINGAIIDNYRQWICIYAGLYFGDVDCWRPLETGDFVGALGNSLVCLLVNPALITTELNEMQLDIFLGLL